MRKNKLIRFFEKYGPEITTAMGVVCMVSSTVLAVKETPKAMEILKKEEEETASSVSKKDAVKLCWKCYIPAAVLGVSGIACITAGAKGYSNRSLAWSAAYEASKNAMNEYQTKVVEKVGAEKEKEIRDEIVKEHKQKPVREVQEVTIVDGTDLIQDSLSGIFFNSTTGKVISIINDLNYQMMVHMYISVKDLHYELGIRNTNDDRGWRIGDGLIEPYFDSGITESGKPYAILKYDRDPIIDYDVLSK